MMKLLLAFAAVAAVALWFITSGDSADTADMALQSGDAAAGERVFWAAGCASCHSAPKAGGESKLVLSGGQKFDSPFGTFVAPNISPDPEAGIGAWSLAEFATALRKGVSPDGQHYYPAFPYTAYAKMTDGDIADLWAFWQGLPPDSTPSDAHQLSFPFSIRRSVAFWKWMNLSTDWVVQDPGTDQLVRGRYLVEALGHCAECHTPRDAFGGLITAEWMGGAENPNGEGRIPNITPAALDWSAEDIAYYLSTGFTPSYDSAGGHMASVVENMAHLPAEDRQAIAAYLKALPPVAKPD